MCSSVFITVNRDEDVVEAIVDVVDAAVVVADKTSNKSDVDNVNSDSSKDIVVVDVQSLI
jgi:hypothetical protein